MKKYFERKDKKTSNFWQIEVLDCSYTIHSGKSGTTGQRTIKKFDSHESAVMNAKKLVANKIKKGFVEISEDASKYYFLICKECKRTITPFIKKIIVENYDSRLNTLNQKDFVEKGFFFNTPWGDYILNIKEDIYLDRSPAESRWIGCCGSGEGEPNLLCECGSGIGRLVNDCMFPEYIRIDHEKVEEVKDQGDLFETIMKLEGEVVRLGEALKSETNTETINKLVEIYNYTKEVIDVFYAIIKDNNSKEIKDFMKKYNIDTYLKA